ncbi:YqaE/Pmp3 family membrane protein [uncultured Methylobacterium sp.]|uniref:YqaE/Pmp3 family membrane protein n=1 Tax=uncultured Methylobacterium sp. TaxID=157278 RepID=UPI0035C9857D
MSSLIRILLAIFLPPIAVLVTSGIGLQFLLNIVLSLLGWLPGTVHALWLMNRDRPLV